MNYFKSLAIVFITLTIVSCKKEIEVAGFSKPAIVSKNHPATWNNNSEEIKIFWNNLITESRCPQGAECFWEGIAEVNFNVEGLTETPFDITLSTLENPPSVFHKSVLDTLGYEFQLISLLPYPELGTSISENDYNATIVVSHQ